MALGNEKISDFEQWSGGDVPAVGLVPFVFGGQNYTCTWGQLTADTLGLGSMAYQNSDSVNITGGNVAVTALSGAITVANGGTGLGAPPANGQLLIGNGTDYTLATLTEGAGVSITEGAGTITIAATGGTGTVTSVDASGGTTGLTFTGGPVTGTGTLTLGGTLAVASGGTGAVTAAAARIALSAAKSGANADITSLTGLTTPLDVPQGGTGATVLSGYLYGNGSLPVSSVMTIPAADLSGQVAIANGGTSATTAAGARAALLPSYAGNGGKVLSVNPGETDTQWLATGGVGTVTSVAMSGGTTGLTFTGGPITAAGTFTAGGTLAVANGGTGLGAWTANGVVYASGTGTLANGSGLVFDGTRLGLGTTSLTGHRFRIAGSITGATTAYSVRNVTTVESDVTAGGIAYSADITTAAAAFSTTLTAYQALQSSPPGAGSTVTAQYGFSVSSNFTGGTDNYAFYAGNTAAVTAGKTAHGFYSAINTATGGGTTWQAYMSGTAPSYFGGGVALGTPAMTFGLRLAIGGTITGSNVNITYMNPSIASSVSGTLRVMSSEPNIPAAVFTVTNMDHYVAAQGPFGAGATVTHQRGFYVTSAMVGGVNNYGFHSDIGAATGRWNFYAAGTANNAFNGNTRFGGVTAPTVAVDVTGAVAATTTVRTGTYLVAALPAAATAGAGARAFVTDATVTTFASVVAGTGANAVPVYSDGAAWRIG